MTAVPYSGTTLFSVWQELSDMNCPALSNTTANVFPTPPTA